MKFKLLFVLILSGIGLSAQETFTFSYRLDYEFPKTEESEEGYIFGKHYIPEKYTESTKNSLLDLNYFSMMGAGYGFTFLDGDQAIQIQNSDLDNNFVISKFGTDHSYGENGSVEKLYDRARFQKFDRESIKILDYSCNHYQLFVTKRGEEQEEDTRMVFCIDESNPIDNTTFLLPKQEGTPIKGLILSISSPDNNPSEMIFLTKINKINSTIKFDLQKELAAYKVQKDSLDKYYSENYDDIAVAVDSVAVVEGNYNYYNEYMNSPEFCNYTGFYDLKFEDETSYSIGSSYMSNLCSYAYYLKKGDEEKFKKFALKEIKSSTKNFSKAGIMPKKDSKIFYEYLKNDLEVLQKSKPNTDVAPEMLEAVAAADATMEVAVEAVDGAVGYDYYEPSVSDYESDYKNLQPEDSSFAITSLQEDSGSAYWKGIPAYCKKFDSVVPNFSDEALKKHAKNYAGQICDMYLGEFDGSGVWYKGTLDAIRAEQLYFNNNKDKFSKKDKELLDEFLNSLD